MHNAKAESQMKTSNMTRIDSRCTGSPPTRYSLCFEDIWWTFKWSAPNRNVARTSQTLTLKATETYYCPAFPMRRNALKEPSKSTQDTAPSFLDWSRADSLPHPIREHPERQMDSAMGRELPRQETLANVVSHQVQSQRGYYTKRCNTKSHVAVPWLFNLGTRREPLWKLLQDDSK